MKKIFLTTLLATGIAFLVNNTAKAQNRIGFIDMNELLNSMPDTKKADTLLRVYNEALIANANDMQKDLDEKVKQFVKDSAKLTPAVKEAQRTALKDKVNELSGMDQKIQGKVEEKRNELGAPIQKKAMDAVKAVAKENGYTHVFPKEYVYVFPEADDLLDKAKKKLGIK
jgi:outer membrane protein